MEKNCFVCRVCEVTYNPQKNEYLGVEKVSVDGRIVSRTAIMIDDPVHRYDGLKFSDFYLENLIASGMDLKAVTMDVSPFVVLDACPNIPNVESKSE